MLPEGVVLHIKGWILPVSVSTIELDPWGGETNRSSNEAFQPKKFTSYERDANGSDDAMHRRYSRWHSRFDQPDPYDGSYSLTDPQSFNRYAYVQNDPVSFVDPSGLMMVICGYAGSIDGNSIIQCDFFSNTSYRFAGHNPPDRPVPNPTDPPDNPTEQPQQSCDPHFFGESDSFNIGGRAFTGGDLNVAARVVYAESSSGFSNVNNGPVGSQVFDERNAIASVLYNLLSPTLSSFNAVATSGRFQAVSSAAHNQKFLGSSISTGAYRNLSERTADGRGGDCNDLRSSVDAIRRMVNNNGPS